jgi:prepilin-type N-terminal cleavage/methylation domain-containing protein
MMPTHTRTAARPAASQAGFSLVELLIAMAVTTLIMGVTMAGLSDAMRANDIMVQVTTMNNGLRVAMDLMVRDLLQTGSGLPKGHVILVPSGGELIRRPGPPGTAYTNNAGDLNIAAVIPGDSLGPTINDIPTDIITILTADNNFTDVNVTAVTSTSVTVAAGINLAAGVDRVTRGQLMMITKGTATTLVQVTGVDAGTRVLTFAVNDSLRLNQTGGGIAGNLQTLIAQAPTGAAGPAATRVTRIRMITYYLDDTTTPGHPRLVRRINNGSPTVFDNTLGTAVALEIENLQFSYDINDGGNNPSNVEFVPDDFTGAGACNPDECSPTQIRKINITMTARSQDAAIPGRRGHRNTLMSQVALRGMALVNDYQQ